ncbi:hypothetical protein BWQ96_05711 [Gracilariopsis chorda]|uniref:Uncharacterized protein n=1 Tax=Gracilariopsis chorda TaxID=448386 RepID=A0A2V3IR11_9FLOR|nr:hypothetical protein BWQ96_05711 [Gracilariopsis chorda]|eukprot:PXF44533.1 hypothetical protein BWQ96_05711 [Gracilariopsis chorda]
MGTKLTSRTIKARAVCSMVMMSFLKSWQFRKRARRALLAGVRFGGARKVLSA